MTRRKLYSPTDSAVVKKSSYGATRAHDSEGNDVTHYYVCSVPSLSFKERILPFDSVPVVKFTGDNTHMCPALLNGYYKIIRHTALHVIRAMEMSGHCNDLEVDFNSYQQHNGFPGCKIAFCANPPTDPWMLREEKTTVVENSDDDSHTLVTEQVTVKIVNEDEGSVTPPNTASIPPYEEWRKDQLNKV